MNKNNHKITTIILSVILAASLAVSLTACGGASSKDPSLDVDLTKMSATMVYSEVFDMMYKPEDYMGKKIKMQGELNAVYDEENNDIVFTCIIQDATQCCAQGVEFRLKEPPEVYPEGGSEITVVGTYDTYERDGTENCYLKDAAFLES